MSNTNTIPTIGTPATYRSGSNKYAGKIIAVSKSGHRVTWQRVYEAGTTLDIHGNAWKQEFTRRRDGSYVAAGTALAMFYLVLGEATTALDEGF